MKKLRLDLDSLTVESFDPAPDHDGLRGTVDGRQIEPAPVSLRLSDCFRCPETNNSCLLNCNGSCLDSCNGTCICPSPSEAFTACCPIRTQYCDTRLCPIEDTVQCPIQTGIC